MKEEKRADLREVTLFCLPFAGGSSYSYADFQRCSGDSLRITALDLPGRGKRFSEPLLSSIHDMVDDVLGQIRPRLGGAYAIYGHSLGACIGYLLVKRILLEKLPLPLHLFVSGREGPSVQCREKGRHLLPQAGLIRVLKEFGGIAGEVFENREMMDLFEPVLRADFQAIDTYEYERCLPFDIPITVMRGSVEHVSKEDALQWQNETTKKVTLHEFDGGHFFIFSHAREIVRIFTGGVAPSPDVAA